MRKRYLVFMISLLTIVLASCASFNQGMKDFDRRVKAVGAYTIDKDTKLLIHYSKLATPKSGCLLTASKEINDDQVMVAKIEVSATPKKEDATVEPNYDDMKRILYTEACAVGGDGVVGYQVNKSERVISGLVWSFKKRMRGTF